MGSTPAGEALAGGGDLGGLIRSLHWNRTPLGPADAWPQSLRTSVSIVLASRFPLSIWWGPEYVLLYNDAYAPLLGSKHPAALGRPALEVWSEIKEIIGPMLAQVSATGEATFTTNGLLPLDRHGFLEECYFTWSYSPIRVESGGVGGVFTVVTETTEQVLEERRRRLLRELATATSGAKQVEEACRAAARTFQRDVLPFSLIYLLDDDGRTARLVATSELEAGQPASPQVVDLLSPTAAWPFSGARDSGATQRVLNLEAKFGALPSGGWPAPPREAIVLPLSRPNEQSPYGFLVAGLHPGHPVDESHLGFFDLVGSQLSLAITNARAFEETEARARALADLDRAKIAFFSNVSHEFRTPLTLLLGPVEDGLRDPDHPPDAVQRERLEIVRRNALRLLRLVNTLLDFSRLEAGRAQASYEPVDLAAFTSDLVSNFHSAIERAGLALVVDFPAPVPAFVDRDMWEKIVFNLLSNALKFTFAGEIRLSLRQVDGRVEFKVRDTGSGIPAAELPKIFTRFHRVQGVKARTNEGSGIGLAFVHELVRLHGGTASVASAPGEGATFTVSIPTGSGHLPAERLGPRSQPTAIGAMPFVEEVLQWLPDQGPDASAAAGAPLVAARAAGAGLAPRLRIVVAEDNADMRAYLRRILEERWVVEAVDNGADALLSARRRLPDLLLADVMMPIMDGFELVRALRADSYLRDVPVILLSARAGQEARIEGLKSGAEDYLVKPFSAPELIARVALHLELGRSRAGERSARDQLHRRLMQLPAGILALRGKDHVIEMANPEYQRLVNQRAVRGVSLAEAMPEFRGQPFIPQLDEVFRTGVPMVAEEARAMMDRHGKGVLEECFFNYTYQPTFSAPNQIDGVVVFTFEVTAQVRARQRVESLVTQAMLADSRKDEFLAMLGHELRNPLAPIVTAVKLMKLKGGGLLRPEREVIERQVMHLTRLVDDLLDVSRIAQGKVQLEKSPLDIAAVAARAVEGASPIFESKSQQLTVEVPRGQLYVEGDPGRLAQVLGNLLVNAGKYTQAGGHISLTAVREGDWVVIKVQDDGIGIAPEFLPRVFDLFAQSARSLDRAEGGLGLGLALVRNLIALHGGQVAAVSEGLSRGSEFIVRLPAVEPLALARGGEGSPGPQAAPRRKILVVDDNVDAAEMLAEFLTAEGHEVAVAHDGPGALLLQAAFRPDLSVLDLGLPVMDGFELATLMKHAGAPRLVALTGYGQEEDRQRSRSAGFEAHLVKPVDLEKLSELIAQLCGGEQLPASDKALPS